MDASITLSWLLPDEVSAIAIAVRDQDLLNAEAVWVPAHWRLEVCNSLWMAERRNRLDAAGVTQAAALFLKIPVTIDTETNDRSRSRDIGPCPAARAFSLRRCLP